MAIEYKEMINIGGNAAEVQNVMRTLWFLYKFFDTSTQYTIVDQSPTSWPATEDLMASGPDTAWFVVGPTNNYVGSTETWQIFIGAATYAAASPNFGPYASIPEAGLYVDFNAMTGGGALFEWDAVTTHDWGASAVTTGLVSVLSAADSTTRLHLMQIHCDRMTIYFGVCTQTGTNTYFEQNRGFMAGYYKNPLPTSGGPPAQVAPGMLFTGYPTVTNASPSWAYAPTAPASQGWVLNYANNGYDRARLSYFYGQTTAYMRGRKPGTFVNMPIHIYGMQSGNNNILYLAGFTTLVLATSMDRAWFTSDGNRRNLVRISLPNTGTEITW
jgi:hypothetical protein